MTARAAALAAGAALALGCATRPPPPVDPTTQSLLEVAALIRLHVGDDTYRFEPARDRTGKNVYRVAFERLESLETAHDSKLASGYATDVVWFAKARALERIGEYELARLHYARVAELDSELAPAARTGQEISARLVQACAIVPAPALGAEQAAARFADRREALEQLRADVERSHWVYVVDEELERGDEAEVARLAAYAALDPRYEPAALERAQRLVQVHRESKHHNRHLLALADLYAALSQRYAREFPPQSLGFDPATFDEYAHGATRVYEVVAQQDGTVEKLEAAHKLEAFLGFTLRVHEERLPR